MAPATSVKRSPKLIQDPEVTLPNALENPQEALKHVQGLMSMGRNELAFYGRTLVDQLRTQPSEAGALMLVFSRALYLRAPANAELSQTIQNQAAAFDASREGREGLAAQKLAQAAEVYGMVDPILVEEPVIQTVKGWDGDIVDGTYTVILPGGDYRTLKIRTQDQDATFKPGTRLISYLNGPDNWKNYQGFGEVLPGNVLKVWLKHQSATQIIACAHILLSGPEAMVDGLMAYGIASGSCGVCGKKLTTPESLERGIGPECAKALGL